MSVYVRVPVGLWRDILTDLEVNAVCNEATDAILARANRIKWPLGPGKPARCPSPCCNLDGGAK